VIGSTTALAERSTDSRAFPENRAWPVVCYILCILGRILRGALSIALAVGLIAACVAPTLPLPPPDNPNMEPVPGSPGQVKLVSGPGGAEPAAFILIESENTSLPLTERTGSALTDSKGAWSAVIYANKGDYVNISQIYGTQESPSNTVQILY
jgi:hypothetical protein